MKAGAVVVDNSSAFRTDPAIPLVIPEINARRITDHKGIIANPNCAAITTLVPLWPVHQVNPVRRLIVSTYQAASGGGAALMEELELSTRAYLDGKDYPPKVVKYPYAFNLFSHNTAIDMATGYNDEESKVIKETKKIFEDDRIAVVATCIRVPVLRAHSVSMTFECERPITPEEVKALLAKAPGVKLVDDWANNYFPMPKDASGQGDVLAGRIRKDLSDPVRQVDQHVRGGGSAAEGRGAERGADRGIAVTLSLSCARRYDGHPAPWVSARLHAARMSALTPGMTALFRFRLRPIAQRRESSTAPPSPWP